jgi:hypothetical protein
VFGLSKSEIEHPRPTEWTYAENIKQVIQSFGRAKSEITSYFLYVTLPLNTWSPIRQLADAVDVHSLGLVAGDIVEVDDGFRIDRRHKLEMQLVAERVLL